jgi:hypothetical protein
MAFEYLATGRGDKWFGPGVAEDEETYVIATEKPQERELLDLFRAMRAPHRAAQLEILKP